MNKQLEKAVTLWIRGRYDEARFLAATKLTVEEYSEFVRRCLEATKP